MKSKTRTYPFVSHDISQTREVFPHRCLPSKHLESLDDDGLALAVLVRNACGDVKKGCQISSKCPAPPGFSPASADISRGIRAHNSEAARAASPSKVAQGLSERAVKADWKILTNPSWDSEKPSPSMRRPKLALSCSVIFEKKKVELRGKKFATEYSAAE